MEVLEPILGLVVVLAAGGLMLFFTLPRRGEGRGLPRVQLRTLRPMTGLRRATGLAVENGTRVHVTIGKSSIIGPNNASSLVALSTLERIGVQSSMSDRPPVVTSGDGTLAILSQDTLRAAYRFSNVPEMYDPAQARLAGPTPFSYVAGALPVIQDERVSANVLVGNFGPEAALLTEAAGRENAFSLAGSDSFAAQAVFYASADEPLIGEELFAVPAYLQAGAIHRSSLRTQDILRWLVIGVLVIGALATFVLNL